MQTIATPQPGHLTAVFLGSTAFIFLNFGLPIYADELGADAVAIGGMYTVFTFTMLLVRPLVGWCLDHYGRRWFFTSAFAFYCVAMTTFAHSDTLLDFYLARFLQGIGASLMWVSARTIIADVNASSTRGIAMGRLMSTSVQGSMVGAFYGFTLLGFMPVQQAWRLAFAGYALAAFMGLLWSFFFIKETKASGAQALSRVEFSTPLKKLMLIVFLSGFASALIEPIYLLFLKHKFELGMMGLAAAFLPAGLVFAVLPRYAGQWSDRYGRAPVIATGIALAGMVSGGLPWMPSIWLVALFYILFAVGWATAGPAEDALVSDLAPGSQRGRVIGAKEAAAGAGAALGPLAGGLIYEHASQEATFVTNGLLLLVTAALTRAWFYTHPSPDDHIVEPE